jgi:hypothetical protein
MASTREGAHASTMSEGNGLLQDRLRTLVQVPAEDEPKAGLAARLRV